MYYSRFRTSFQSIKKMKRYFFDFKTESIRFHYRFYLNIEIIALEVEFVKHALAIQLVASGNILEWNIKYPASGIVQ